jgi:acyl-CoA synthetase (AMP-forming)/AMP-acid ligase II
VIAMYGILKAGCVMVPFKVMLKADEIPKNLAGKALRRVLRELEKERGS